MTLFLEELLLLPESFYKGEIKAYRTKSKAAILVIEVTEGEFSGRKVPFEIGSNGILTAVMVACKKPFDADTTAQKALDSLIRTKVSFKVNHKLFESDLTMSVVMLEALP